MGQPRTPEETDAQGMFQKLEDVLDFEQLAEQLIEDSMATQILKMASFRPRLRLLRSSSHSMPFEVHYHHLSDLMPL
jgi:hypothetical protein